MFLFFFTHEALWGKKRKRKWGWQWDKLNDDKTECFTQWVWIYKVTLFLRATGILVAAALIKISTKALQHQRSTPVLPQQAFWRFYMPLYGLLNTPFSAPLWYHYTWSLLASTLNWPSHFHSQLSIIPPSTHSKKHLNIIYSDSSGG